MASRLENLIILLTAAGWQEKAIKQVIGEIKDLPLEQFEKDMRSLRRRLAKLTKAPAKARDRETAAQQSATRAAKLLRSGTSLAVPEIAQLLLDHLRNRNIQRELPPLPSKGSFEDWLLVLAKEIGPADFLLEVSAFNRLARTSGHSWRLRQ